VHATLDAARSRPESDIAVLSISVDAPPQLPLLHALDPAVYEGTLPKRATGYTHMAPQTFDARVGTATSLDLAVTEPGGWPERPERYVIRDAFRLADPTDARPGVSGAVVAYEGGVLGLAHFARAAGEAQERELYLVPLTAWADGWEELAVLIEPLLDQALRDAALVRRVRDINVGMSNASGARDPDLIIAGYRANVYCERPEKLAAEKALSDGGLLIIGRPKSGKTRLAWEVLRNLPEAVVVMPRAPQPPAEFEVAGLSRRQLILLCDDLHSVAERLEPLRWRERLSTVSSPVYLVATIRDGSDWKRVRDNQAVLLDAFDQHRRIFVSKVGESGEDLLFESARDLAGTLGISKDEFARRFDGTPGSLTLDLGAMRTRYERLREEQIGGSSASRLLDSVKLLHAAGQASLDEDLTRAAAEEIRGVVPVSAENWEALSRRTQDEGFGRFTHGEFVTYRPYLEECVAYEPSAEDLDQVLALLARRSDWVRVIALGIARTQRGEPREAIEALRAAMAALQAVGSGDSDIASLAAVALGRALDGEGDAAGARAAYHRAIESGDPVRAPLAAAFLGGLLRKQGELAGACAAYQQAIDSGHRDLGAMAAVQLGLTLERQGDVAGARAAFQLAIDSGHPDQAPMAAVGLGGLLVDEADLEGARTAYQQAIDSAHPDHAPNAATALGFLLEAEQDLVGARAAYGWAVASGHPDVAPTAAVQLGLVLERQGDVAGARAAYQRAIDSGDSDQAPKAAVGLGGLLEEEGDLAGSDAAYEEAMNSDHPEFAPMAAFNLGVSLARRQDLATACAAYSKAIDSGHPVLAPEAAFNLGRTLARLNDFAGARAAYQEAIHSEHQDVRQRAQTALDALG
jgi:tetratricopeptide (TPR) repeat protein